MLSYTPKQQALAGITIDRSFDPPVYVQICERLRDLILSGRVPAGMQLPSSREFSIDLGVSRKTIISAYDQLISEGYLSSRPGAGTYVEDIPNVEFDGRKKSAAPPLSLRTDKTAPLSPSAPDMGGFPLSSWSRAAARGQRNLSLAAKFEAPNGGLMSLRCALVDHLHAMRGINCAPEQIIVTTGIAESIQLIGRSLFQSGQMLACENPGHPGTQAQIAGCGLMIMPIPVDADGFQTGNFVENHSSVTGVLVTSTRQFPLGMQLSLSRRMELLAWARRQTGWILEDDFDCEYRFSGRPSQSVFSLDPANRTLYLGSLSKVLFPNLRLSFIVAPIEAATRIIEYQNTYGSAASMSVQAALSEFMRDGQFSTHIRRMRRLYARRYTHILNRVKQTLSEYLIPEPVEGGMHFVARFRETGGLSSDTEIAETAVQAGLGVVPLSQFYLSKKSENQGLLIGFSGTDEMSAEKAIYALKHVFEQSARS